MSNKQKGHPILIWNTSGHVVCFGLVDLWISNSFIRIDENFFFLSILIVDLCRGMFVKDSIIAQRKQESNQ